MASIGRESEHPVAGDAGLLDFALLLIQNARLLLGGSILVGLIAFGLTFLIAPTFTAKTTILPPQQKQSGIALLAAQVGALVGMPGGAGTASKEPIDLYVALIKSRVVADSLISRFDLKQVYEAELLQDARKALASATRIATGKDWMITIEVDDKDPKRAAGIANGYAEELAKLTGRLAISEAQRRRVFFEEQLRIAHSNLAKAQEALAQAGIPEEVVKSSPETTLTTIARLQALITAQEVKLSTLQGVVTEHNPEFRRAKRELESLRSQLARIEKDHSSEKATSAGAYLSRYREFKYQETLFELLAKQYEAARLEEAQEGGFIQVVDAAIPPERKSRPRRGLIAALSAMTAMMLLVLFVLLRASLRNALRDSRLGPKLRQIHLFRWWDSPA